MKTYSSPRQRFIGELPSGLIKRKPRSYAEWRALRRWGKLPAWELEPAGYLLRLAREQAGLTQREMALRLGTSQQAVAQAERWRSNPTIDFMRRWAAASGRKLSLSLPRRVRRGSETPEGTTRERPSVRSVRGSARDSSPSLG